MRFLAVPLSWARRPTVIEGKVVERLEGWRQVRGVWRM